MSVDGEISLGETILVTGGAGYIGSHTASILKDAGYKPVIVDNLATGNQFATTISGPFERGDIGDPAFIREVCRKYKPTGAIHFAAYSLVQESVANPDKYFENNRDRAGLFFETAAASGVRHVVFSSTAAVYGAQGGEKPITEDTATVPINPYGQSKLEAEERLRSTNGLTSVALRYFNAAGGMPERGLGECHVPETHLIPAIILGAESNKKPKIFGTDYPTPDGTAVRDYIDIRDLGQAHVLALNYLFKGGKNEICNLGTGTGSSVRQILNAVSKSMGRQIEVEEVGRREGDPAILIANPTRAKEVLGWKAVQSLQTTVDSAVAWHRTSAFKEALKLRHG